MQHSNVLGRHNMHTSARFHMSDLDEAGLESKDIRVGQGKGLRMPFP